MLICDGKKIIKIGQSATKPRIGGGSTTILYGVGCKQMTTEMAYSCLQDEDIVYSYTKV